MTEPLLSGVEIESPKAATHAVIGLHGLGADGHDLAGLVPELSLDEVAQIRWVLPHAPRIPVTLNGGLIMPAWYDVRDLSAHRTDHDEAGIRRTQRRIQALMEREIGRGVPPSRLFLMGFSQGGAMALFTGLRYPERLAGLAGLSTYLSFDDSLETERSAANGSTPIFLAHGTLDPMVPFEAGNRTRARLEKLGCPVTWRTYPMPHAICAEEIEDLRAWFVERLSPRTSSG